MQPPPAPDPRNPHRAPRRARRQLALLACSLLVLTGQSPGERPWSEGEIDAALNKADAARSEANALLAEVLGSPDLVDAFRDGLAGLTPEMLEAIEAGREAALLAIASESEGLDAYLGPGGACEAGSPCAAFRQDVASFLLQIEELGNAVLNADPAVEGLTLSFARAREGLARSSGRSLYPLYRATAVDSDVLSDEQRDALRSWFRLLLGDLRLLIEVLALPVEAQCAEVLTDPDGFERAVLVVKLGSVLLRAIGEFMLAGASSVDSLMVGIDGFVGINIKFNPKKRWGIRLGGVSKGVGLLADQGTFVHRYCTVVENERSFIEAIRASAPPGRGPFK